MIYQIVFFHNINFHKNKLEFISPSISSIISGAKVHVFFSIVVAEMDWISNSLCIKNYSSFLFYISKISLFFL